MDKVVSKVKRVRFNWWEAFKKSVRIPGYAYYKVPAEVKYRYPAPGSVPNDPINKPNLYKHDWKTPFRDSKYNVRVKDLPRKENIEYDAYLLGYSSTELDPSIESHRLVLQGPTIDRRLKPPPHVNINDEFDPYMSREESAKMIRESCEAKKEVFETLCEDFVHLSPTYEDIYTPAYIKFHPRSASPIANDKRMQTAFLNMQWLFEEVIEKQHIESKEMKMYKGNTKKWQILCDQAFARDQIEKIQKAIKGPSPDELERWNEDDQRLMKLPITNANVSEWRDKKLAAESADFNPKMIDYERERGQVEFMKRYEKPKELAE